MVGTRGVAYEAATAKAVEAMVAEGLVEEAEEEGGLAVGERVLESVEEVVAAGEDEVAAQGGMMALGMARAAMVRAG